MIIIKIIILYFIQIRHTDDFPSTGNRLVIIISKVVKKRQSYVRRAGGRGRPRLRWEDCVKRDVRKAGEEEDWKKKTRDRGGWKRLSVEVVKKLRAAPHP